MTKKITSYQEMLEEEERLTQLLKFQQQQIQSDVRGIKEELRPITNIAATAKKFFVRKSGQAITTIGIKLLVDGLVKNFVLAKSGWITRTIIPFLLKNYASHIAQEPEKLVNKIKHMFGKNGKAVRPE
jgi:hypothetical protein